MRKICLVLVLVALTGAGLASGSSSPPGRRSGSAKPPWPDPEAVRAAGLSDAQSEQALKLYTTKCMRCHKSYDPSVYSPGQWELWMTKMSRKAKLNGEQQDLLSRYLEAERATRGLENRK